MANTNAEVAREFVDDLFGSFDRLVCSRDNEDEGRAGWSKQPVIDNVKIVLSTAESNLAQKVLKEIQTTGRPTAKAAGVLRDLFTRLNVKIEGD